MSSELSQRGQRALQPALSYWGKQVDGGSDLYHPDTNPSGYICLAVAENRGSFARLRQQLERGGCPIDDSTGAYTNMRGRADFRSR